MVAGGRRAHPATPACAVCRRCMERLRSGAGAEAQRAARVAASENPLRGGAAGAGATRTMGRLPPHRRRRGRELRARPARAARPRRSDAGSRPQQCTRRRRARDPDARARRGVTSRPGPRRAGGRRGLSAPLEAVLVFGVSHPELLESAARASRRCTAIAHSRRAAQSARAFAQRLGFSCRVLRATSPEVLSETDLARAGEAFDAVLLDTFVSGDALARMLEQVRRVLTPNARLWVFERYESLERSRERIVEHPLARLRRLLGDAGLRCERLSPVEADGEHVLAAVARPAAAAPGRVG